MILNSLKVTPRTVNLVKLSIYGDNELQNLDLQVFIGNNLILS